MMDIILLTVVGALIGAMLPGPTNGGVKKVFAFLAGLIFLLAVFRPIASSVAELTSLPSRWAERLLPQEEELEKEEARTREWVLSFSARNIEQGVDALIVNRFGLSAEAVASTAEVVMNADGQWILKRMVIRLDDSARCDDDAVAQYVRDILVCPCVVQRVERIEDEKGGGGYGG